MKLSKIYSNFPRRFRTVSFNEGLNVVLGRIKEVKARDKDTHNLGKTLFAQMIDFCLLKKRDADFFLYKNDRFDDFVFFLEVETHAGEYVTVRRSVNEASKGAFKRHKTPDQDFSELPEKKWDHWNLPFDKAKEVLDGLLDLTVLKPWSFRQAVSYSLRSQRDYDEPFKLAKFAGSHSEWKPFLSHILGFDGKTVARGYELEEAIATLESEERNLIARTSGVADPDQLRGQIEIVQQEVAGIEQELAKFDFSPEDKRLTRELVSQIDSRIVQLNESRYALSSDRAKIESALGVRLSIDLKSLKKIFEDSKVYFGDQVKKDFDALEKFNKQLAEERDGYLQKDLEEIESQLVQIDEELAKLNERRAEALASLTDNESLSKYKRHTKQLISRQTDLETLRRTENVLSELAENRKEIKAKKKELETVSAALEKAVNKQPDRYKDIRHYFDQIVKKIVDKHGNLYSRVNSKGHLEFDVEVLDDSAKPTSAGQGFSYGRLLCIAFDLAIMRAYSEEPFPHFVFHDGFLETLDDRKKLNLIEVSREYCKYGIQHIVTVIESELPRMANGKKFAFTGEETILSLTDEGDTGRLFKMPPW
ncbi:MAG: DUF2326 domain-containing protein [Planctomycetaceae bacterium]|nr:DUF2326 domain-containing protein [Planctomycetaceae bacterium]